MNKLIEQWYQNEKLWHLSFPGGTSKNSSYDRKTKDSPLFKINTDI